MTEQRTIRSRILIICDYYLPGFKSGGGMRTIVNTVARLSDEFEFHVVTRDHDGKGDSTPYEGIAYGKWNVVGEARVFYLKPDEVSRETLNRLIADVSPSAIYLNSFFSTLTVHTLRLRRRVGKGFPKTMLAPCGELSSGALVAKALKKKFYILASRLSGLYKGVHFKASCEDEVSEIHRAVGSFAPVTVAPDLPAETQPSINVHRRGKTEGSARLVFLSRISPKKNLHFLINVLREFKEAVSLDIYGDADDKEYFRHCAEAASASPKIVFKGPLPHERVPDTLSEYDFFALPTRGENFGHVVLEALSAGCPTVISDTTPWNTIGSEGAGMILPLDAECWKSAVREMTEMGGEAHQRMRKAAIRFAESFRSDPTVEERTRDLLREVSREEEGGIG